MSSVPEAAPQEAIRRYSNAAVTFHWLTVVLVLTQATLGFAFDNMADSPTKMTLFTWHTTIGPLILVLTLIRLGYRLKNPPPPYSPDLPAWERVTGTWNHRIFYALLIALPLTGLAAVSGHAPGPFIKLAFGIPFPIIPGIGKDLGDEFGDIHVVLVFAFVLLIVLHAAAALKHQFFDRFPASGRMPPFQPPGDRAVIVGQGGNAAPAER